MYEFTNSTERVTRLAAALKERSMGNRSQEWFNKKELDDIGKEMPKETVIIRKAHAIKEMLGKMTDETISLHTHTYEIAPDELIVGVLPMGSNGLGKVFPNYLTEEERRVASYTNRTELSILGHNTVNYEKVLEKGLDGIIQYADKKLQKLLKVDDMIPIENPIENHIDFYRSVIISCQAVIDYANRYAELAEKMAEKETNTERKEELMEIARISRKVPAQKPDTFHEALQSIYFFHVALHASLNFISFGRLDQVLNKYLDAEIMKKEGTEEYKQYLKQCTELFECFIIKAAGRLNMTTEYLLEQDHMDNNAALGVHPYYLDQRAGVNNFLQNIIVGGQTPEGEDATNLMTYMILNAFQNVGLSTPGIYVRLGKKSPADLYQAVAGVLNKTKNLPGILNDDVLIPALYNSLIENVSPGADLEEYQKLANDYCVDGCWEPILNGVSDWTFGMLNCMPIMQCAINQGATIDTNPGMLRGGKVSFISEKVTNYEEFQENFKRYMEFFIDQSTFSLYECYMMDEFIIPSPLFSAVLGTCLERGRDKSWGGVDHNIGGTILIGVPDVINTVAAIKKWVFNNRKYSLDEVIDAMRTNFTAEFSSAIQLQKRYTQMKVDFDTNTGKFGTDDPEVIEIGKFVMDTFCNAVSRSKELADKIFLKSVRNYPADEKKMIYRLRKIAGYNGPSLQTKFGKHFDMKFTAGCGTFEQYPLQGMGIVASANRSSNDPMIANFSPSPGTVTDGAGRILESYSQLPMERLSAGAITDLCINEALCQEDVISGLLHKFIDSKGNMLTLTFGNVDLYQNIYRLSYNALNSDDKESAYKQLEQYKDVVVRVGGWQAPFISMSLEQQKNYILRILNN
ncbi:pyruvate formate lyase family protein [Anaeromicropila populeti]|uniref:Glycerol dehydratase, cobalamin-independent, large subunit n=1 Tax=Anaeromicropila populeti TaxID=37658 RepID=A0A1I6KGY0_9FIRM|nr:pyruvate formate lyase family protein [Anaeromicropila populeti]SFR90456.1 glycerol dehydratase, cobalamin-independent, large subunit [Anaeromicropila populeti]